MKSREADLHILCFGHLGGRNFGDELMLSGLLKNIRSGKSSLTVATPSGTLPAWAQEKASAVSLRPFQLLKALYASDVLLVCGGTAFHDAFLPARHFKFRLNLLMLTALYLTTRLMGKKLLLVGIGVGPLKRPLTRFLARIAFGCAAMITVRDQSSWNDLVGLNGSKKPELTHDLALLAVPSPGRRDGVASDVEIVLSLVSSSSISTVAPDAASLFMDRLPALMARLLSEDNKIRLRVVVTSVGAADSDLNVSRAFVAAVQNIARNRCELTVFNGDPEQFLSIFSRAALIIAMRFHVAIAAAAMEVPTIWVPYQRKVLDGAASLGVPDEFVVFPNGELAAKLLYRKAKSFLSQRTPAMARDLANAFANADRNIKLITREIGEDS